MYLDSCLEKLCFCNDIFLKCLVTFVNSVNGFFLLLLIISNDVLISLYLSATT